MSALDDRTREVDDNEGFQNISVLVFFKLKIFPVDIYKYIIHLFEDEAL